MGCLPRKNTFVADPDLQRGKRAEKPDYEHLHDPEKFLTMIAATWPRMRTSSGTLLVQRESYYLSNMSLQVSELNQREWANLEDHVRAWAAARGEVVVFVGPIFQKGVGSTVGAHHVAVPHAYYKIVVDPAKGEAIAFDMNNVQTPIGDLTPFIAKIADIEADTGIQFPLPDGIDRKAKAGLWPGDVRAFAEQKKQVCGKG